MLRHRYLFEQMVRRELRQKYKGSALGVLWYLVNPLVLMGAYALMFGVLLDAFPDRRLPAVPARWGCSCGRSSRSRCCRPPRRCVDQSALVRKVRFPRETIPAASSPSSS